MFTQGLTRGIQTTIQEIEGNGYALLTKATYWGRPVYYSKSCNLFLVWFYECGTYYLVDDDNLHDSYMRHL